MYILHALGRASPYGHQRAGLGGRQPGEEVTGGSYGCEAHGRGLLPNPVKGDRHRIARLHRARLPDWTGLLLRCRIRVLCTSIFDRIC